jgi:thymidine phosphorylase
LGSPVKKGDTLYRIYAEFPADFKFAQDLAAYDNGYAIGSEEQILKTMIAF